MKSRTCTAGWISPVGAGVGLLFLAVTAFAQLGEQTSGESKPVLERKTGSAPVIIGMEAFREVLENGNYLVGPGDEFLLFATGMEQPLETPVLSEGGLFIPVVGTVPVGGLRLRNVHKAIAEAYRKAVKVGEIHVQLSKIRQFPVPVVGMVENPGVRRGSGVERVSEIIHKAGGLADRSSRRNIRVVKTGSLPSDVASLMTVQAQQGEMEAFEGIAYQRVDLSLYEATGLSKYNPFIEDGDLIVVPAQIGSIFAREAVQRPAVHEFVEGDRISDLVALALGVAPSYDPDNAYLFRFRDDNKTMYSLKIEIDAILKGRQEANLLLESGDWLVIKELTSYHDLSTLEIVGEVTLPGWYVVGEEGTTLSKTIALASGVTEDAALSEARVVRQRIRLEGAEEDPEYERIRTTPPADRTEDENQYFIMKTREKPGHMVVDFGALFDERSESEDIELLPGDIVVVPRLQQTVMVSGAAASPGAVVYNSTYTVWDYITKAGGYGWRASKDIRVIKTRTGQIKRAQDIDRIDPGDRIWIKEKPVRDYWTLFTQSMAVIGQVTTAILLYVTITK